MKKIRIVRAIFTMLFMIYISSNVYANTIDNINIIGNLDFEIVYFIGLYVTAILSGIFMLICVQIRENIAEDKEIKRIKRILTGYVNKEKLPKKEDVNYYRDIPCDNNMYLIYGVIKHYDIIPENKLKANLIIAYFLDLIKDKKIKLTGERKYIEIIDLSEIDDLYEKEFANIISVATAGKRKVSIENLRKYINRDYYRITYLLEKVEEHALKELEKNDYISLELEKVRVNNMIKPRKVITFKDKMKQEAINILGLAHFLDDCSLMEEKKTQEVVIWENYLIFASLMGMTETVAEECKDIMLDIKYTALEELSKSVYTSMDRTIRISDRKSYKSNKNSSDSTGRGTSSNN